MIFPFRSILAFTLSTSSKHIMMKSRLSHKSTTMSSASRRTTRLFATQPHSPPGTLGAPIFPNVSLTSSHHHHHHNNIPRNDPNAVYVVTGASRGIGKQFCQTLLEEYQGTIVACCRNPDTDLSFPTTTTTTTGNTYNSNRIIPLQLDLLDPISIQQAGERLREQLQGRSVHVLLNVAGILHDDTHSPERALSQIQSDWFMQTMQVNVLGPILWTQQVLPLMQTSSSSSTTTTTMSDSSSSAAATPRIIANLSARVGSITDNQLGGWYSYRISKAALNQFTRTTALELSRSNHRNKTSPPIYCVALHPGTTKTDLSGPFQQNVKPEALFEPTYTVQQLLHVLQNVEAKHSGGLYDWAGQAISF